METDEFKAKVRESREKEVGRQTGLTRSFLSDMNQPNAGLEKQLAPMQVRKNDSYFTAVNEINVICVRN